MIRATKHRERVGELEHVGQLVLRQEVGRAETIAARREVHARQPAGHTRIDRDAAEIDSCLPERIVVRRGLRLVVAEAQLVERVRRDRVVPAGRERLRLHVLTAPRRRARAVGNAAEVARNESIAIGLEVAREQVVAVAEVDVAADEIPLRVVGRVRGAEVVARAGRVRQREQIHHLPRDGIDAVCRNRVVCERLAGERIAHGSREDALTLVRRRHRRLTRDPLRQPRRLDVAEEERLALHDRPAEIAAEVVLLVIRFRHALPDREKVVRIELVVAQEFVGGPVQRVRARLGRHANRGAR